MATNPDYTEDVLGRNGGALPITGSNTSSTGATTTTTLTTGGTLFGVAVNFTRPADTTAYAAKDVVGPAVTANLTFAGAARVNVGSGYIVKAKLSTDQKTNTSTFRLWLFNAAPTAIADNSPFLLLYADIASRIGYIDFPALSTEDGTNSTGAESIVTVSSIGPLSFICAVASTTLYAILELTNAAFTPASGQNFHVGLSFDQN